MTQEDYKKIITLAVEREIEAYEFYRSVTDKTDRNDLKSLFGDLANDELKHRNMLEGFLTKSSDKIHFSETKDYRVVDALPTPPLSLTLKPLEGIVIAVKKELEAMQMYIQLANASLDEEQKKIFREFANMERGHKSRLEDIYINMAFPETW